MNHSLFLKFLLFLLLAASCSSPGSKKKQEEIVTTIYGTVMDAATNAPIAGASVTTQPFSESVTTNANGQYKIELDVEVAASYQVSAAMAGYSTSSVPVEVTEGETTQVDLALDPIGGELYVDTNAINIQVIDNGASSEKFVVTNNGSGTLAYEVTLPTTASWLSLAPAGNKFTLTAGQSATFTVTANGSQATTLGEHTAAIQLTSNGGNATITVTMNKVDSAQPVLQLNDTPVSFGNTATSATFGIQNAGGGILNWRVEYMTAAPWLFLSVDTGITQRTSSGMITTVTLTVDRTLLPNPGTNSVQLNVIPENGMSDPMLVTVSVVNNAECVQGNIWCVSGTQFRRCEADGSWSEASDVCPDDQYCDQEKDTCLPQVCDPGMFYCMEDNTIAAECNTLGSAIANQITCPAGEWCQNGGCECKPVCTAATDGRKLCGDNGCGGVCGVCNTLTERCGDDGYCVELTYAELHCDENQPTGTLNSQTVCVQGSFMGTHTKLNADGCAMHLDDKYCLVSDKFDGMSPNAGPTDANEFKSANYKIEFTLIR